MMTDIKIEIELSRAGIVKHYQGEDEKECTNNALTDLAVRLTEKMTDAPSGETLTGVKDIHVDAERGSIKATIILSSYIPEEEARSIAKDFQREIKR